MFNPVLPPPTALPFADLFRRAFARTGPPDPEADAAYAATVQPFHDRIYTTAYRLVGDVDRAETVRSEVFEALIKEASKLKFESSSPLKVWLYRTTVNRACRELCTPGHSPEWPDELLDPTPGLGELEDLDADRRAVQRALGRLSAEDQVLLAMRAADDRLTAGEIAAILDITAQAVRTRLTRALNHLFGELPPDVRERYTRGGHCVRA